MADNTNCTLLKVICYGSKMINFVVVANFYLFLDQNGLKTGKSLLPQQTIFNSVMVPQMVPSLYGSNYLFPKVAIIMVLEPSYIWCVTSECSIHMHACMCSFVNRQVMHMNIIINIILLLQINYFRRSS